MFPDTRPNAPPSMARCPEIPVLIPVTGSPEKTPASPKYRNWPETFLRYKADPLHHCITRSNRPEKPQVLNSPNIRIAYCTRVADSSLGKVPSPCPHCSRQVDAEIAVGGIDPG